MNAENQNVNSESSMGFFEALKTQANDYITNPELLLTILGNIVLAILIFWIGKKLAKWISNLFAKALVKSKADPILVSFIKNLSYFTLLIVVIFTALGQLGVNTGSIVGVMAAAGLAVGLALKDSLSNFASGVMIIIFKPIKLGDFVEIAGLTGTVREIRIFSTIMNTSDNKLVIIPNGLVMSDPIINYTNQATRRVDMAIGVSYDDDLKLAKKIMMDVVNAHSMVLEEPAPSIILTELGDNSVNFSIRAWANTPDYWTVYSDCLEEMKTKLEEGGCSIPYPQRDVHMHNSK